jgi:hypothetical protein
MLVPERVLKSGKTCPAFQIDDDLAPVILKLKWFPDHQGYLKAFCRTLNRGNNIRLHAYVFFLRHGRWPSMQIDHINRDKLDNRSDNLRDVTPQQNISNKSCWVGGRPRVESNEQLPKYVYSSASAINPFAVRPLGTKYIGSFPTVEEAVKARDCYLTSIGRRIPQ